MNQKFSIKLLFSIVISIVCISCSQQSSHNSFGDKAKSFSAKSYNPINRSIEEYTYRPGKWTVLYFYPADFTSTCPTEIGAMESIYKQFQKIDVDLVGISTDSVQVHADWHKSEPLIKDITYPLLSDSDGKISQQFGVYNYTEGLSQRSTVVINPNGEVVVLEIIHKHLSRSTKELLRKLEALIYIEKFGGVCRVNWESSKDTIHP